MNIRKIPTHTMQSCWWLSFL